jgi:hypothetical protein
VQKIQDQDNALLKKKATMIEKLKRDCKQLEKENMRLQKGGGREPAPTSPSKSRQVTQSARDNKLKTIMKHGRKVKKETDEWISQGLDHTIQHFNEMFINNLSLSFTQVFNKEE